MRLKKYFNNENEFVQYKDKLRLHSCPNPKCTKTGFLVLHGPLKNHGHRCLCSNRNSNKGCGVTFSFTWGNIIKNHMLKTNELWLILKNLLSKYHIKNALKRSRLHFSRRAVNHWLNKLKKNQITIRQNLIKITSPPKIMTHNPLLQTIAHLKHCFPETCPIQNYQVLFQRTIFN